MIIASRQHLQLETRLSLCVRASADAELLTLLQGLNNAEFRRAGMLLGEKILPEHTSSPAAFWRLFKTIVSSNQKAYLGTFLKAAVLLYKNNRLDFLPNADLQAFAQTATPIDCRKILEALLPIIRTPHEMYPLLKLFAKSNRDARVSHLIKAATKQAYFCLFEELRTHEGDTPFIRQTALMLIKQNNPMAYNAASIFSQYFGLKDIPCTFALKVEPYELSHLEHSYESFLRILTK